MHTIDDHKFKIVETRIANTFIIGSESVRKCVKALRSLFQPRCDLNHISQHLRSDAGIDELELERDTIARAPLIRL